MSVLEFEFIQMLIDTRLKEYKQLSHINLKDWRVLTSEHTPKELYDWMEDHPHIMIEWEVHSKFSIVSIIPINMDDKEWFIKSQPSEIQQKLREKIRFRKRELGEDTSLDYLKNYVKNLLESNA